MSLDAAIARIARRQHGLVTTAQLHAVGLQMTMIRRRVAAGRLHRIHRGVYAVGHRALSREARWLAAVLAVGGELTGVSHFAAATSWGIWKGPVRRIDVVTARDVRRRLDGVQVHRSGTLDHRDIVVRGRIPITSVARTILDLAEVLDPYRLADVIHEAEFRELFDERELRDLLARNRGRACVTVARDALRVRATGSAGSQSEFERAWRLAARRRGLNPLVNVEVPVPDGGTVRPDAVFLDEMLVVEIDGGGHQRARTKREDLGRMARLREGGFHTLRCVAATLEAQADVIEANLDEVEAYLAAARERSPNDPGEGDDHDRYVDVPAPAIAGADAAS